MNSPDESLTAVDVIRYVWLARMAAKRGDNQSTRRWQAKADAWIERHKYATRPDALGDPGQLAPEPPADLPTTHAT